MASFFLDLWDFALSVVGHWRGYLTGSLVTGLLFVAERLFGWSLSKRDFFIVFVVAFLLASFFFAWRDERQSWKQAREIATNLSTQLDDRQRQQEKADAYQPMLQAGRKILVKWVDASLKKNESEIAEHRKAAFQWLERVRANLEADFGPAVAGRFNLGKPPSTLIGLSEPEEHDARLVTLDKLMQEMRAGQLPIRLKRQP